MRFFRFVVIVSLAQVACRGEATEASPPPSADAAFVCPDAPPKAGDECASGGYTQCVYGTCPPAGRFPTAICSNHRWTLTETICEPPRPPPPDAGPMVPDETIGTACTNDDACDRSGNGTSFCSLDAFGEGPVDPTPACIGTYCDTGTSAAPQSCDGERGLCLASGSSTLCIGKCTFDLASDAPPSGCIGKDACHAYGVDASGKGVGFCLGGCSADIDCPVGSRCQLETSLCLKTVTAFSKSVGDACTSADVMPPEKCNCLYDAKTLAGYCTKSCLAGFDACPTGFVCDPRLPPKSTAVPTGIAGECLRVCSTDADCAAGTRCRGSAAMVVQTCQPNDSAF